MIGKYYPGKRDFLWVSKVKHIRFKLPMNLIQTPPVTTLNPHTWYLGYGCYSKTPYLLCRYLEQVVVIDNNNQVHFCSEEEVLSVYEDLKEVTIDINVKV